jgi:RHS repeat-associated protein
MNREYHKTFSPSLFQHWGARVSVDHTGTAVGYDDFYPFGGVMPGRSMNAANPNDIYKFTGIACPTCRKRDAEIGLDYMLARNYDPEIGRFLSVDPLADKFPGWSPYNYTMNNPVNMVDPDGKQSIDPHSLFSGLMNAMANSKSYLGDLFRADQKGQLGIKLKRTQKKRHMKRETPLLMELHKLRMQFQMRQTW